MGRICFLSKRFCFLRKPVPMSLFIKIIDIHRCEILLPVFPERIKGSVAIVFQDPAAAAARNLC